MERYKEYVISELGVVVLDRVTARWGILVKVESPCVESPDGLGTRSEIDEIFFTLEEAESDFRISDSEKRRVRELQVEMRVNPPCNIWQEQDYYASQGPVVVTRHPALVDLLIERRVIEPGVKVLAHAAPEDIAGKHVIGVLPLSLAVLADKVTEIPLALSTEDRGKELDINRLREIAGNPVTYKVTIW